jgi:hypothetical protein
MAKNTKQSKQKKSVLNKLGGLSKRSKFIVVVLIFAVLGGGYLTYKSFAATAAPASVVTFGDKLKLNSYWSTSGTGNCTDNRVNDASKNNAVVLQIYCPPQKFWRVQSDATRPTVFFPQGSYTICTMIKGVGKFRVYQRSESNSTYHQSAIFSINSPDYKEYCSKPISTGPSGRTFAGGDSGDIVSSEPNNSATLLTILSTTKRWYAPGTAPATGGK